MSNNVLLGVVNPGGDAVHVSGESSDNFITGNQVKENHDLAYRWNNGVNIADSTCERNVVVNNFLGIADDYVGDAIVDSGTGTMLTYPGGAYGDNFTT